MTDTTTTTMADLMAMEPEDFAAALERIWPRRISSPTMPSSESVLNIAGALAKAQGEFPPIPRDRTVTVKMKDRQTGAPKGEYTFAYAPLSTIREKTRPALAAAELAIVQAIIAEPTANGGVIEVLRTTLVHSSGEWLACDVPMFHGTGDNKAQAYNSGATYARRLGVTLLLCIAADEDDDGNGGDQTNATPDYERQEQATYRGNFPRGGGGQQNRQQGGNGPRAPQRRQAGQAPAQRREDPPAQQAQQAAPQDDEVPFQDDDLPHFGLAQFQGGGDGVSDAVQHDGDGVVTTPWGDGLTAGQLSMAKSRASVAGLTDAQVLELTGPITPANVSDALATLKRAADAALDA